MTLPQWSAIQAWRRSEMKLHSVMISYRNEVAFRDDCIPKIICYRRCCHLLPNIFLVYLTNSNGNYKYRYNNMIKEYNNSNGLRWMNIRSINRCLNIWMLFIREMSVSYRMRNGWKKANNNRNVVIICFAKELWNKYNF